MKRFLLLFVLLLTAGSIARADTLLFTLSGQVNGSFELDSNPTPDDFVLLITKCYNWGTALTSLKSPAQPIPPTSMVARTATTSPTTAAVFGQR